MGFLVGLMVMGLTGVEVEGQGPLIVAHRGASHDAPENTLAAFQLAWEQGADGIEGDFYLTRDGEVVCIHDRTTGRTAARDLVVAHSTLAELRALDVGSWKDPRFASERIPTLQQVIDTVPTGKWLLIELKAGPEIVAPVKKILDTSGLPSEQVLIIGFDERTVAEAKRCMPRVKAHWLTSYKKNPQTGRRSPTPTEIAQTIQRAGADGLGTKGDREVVTEEFLAAVRERGVDEFHVWTVDDPQDAQFFAEQGAFGITTNRPLEIRKELKKMARE